MKLVIRIGNTLSKDGKYIESAFAVDREDRRLADKKRIRVRTENALVRLERLMQEGLGEMLVPKDKLVYVGAKVIVWIDKVTGVDSGHCHADYQIKRNCPAEFADGAKKLYDNIVGSGKVARVMAEEMRRAHEAEVAEANERRRTCKHCKCGMCVASEDGEPPDFSCLCFNKGYCVEAK